MLCTHAILQHRDAAGQLQLAAAEVEACSTLNGTCLRVSCVHFTGCCTGCCYCVQDKSTDIIDAIARCVWRGCLTGSHLSLCSHVHAVLAHHSAGEERAVSAALPSAQPAVCCVDLLLNICQLCGFLLCRCCCFCFCCCCCCCCFARTLQACLLLQGKLCLRQLTLLKLFLLQFCGPQQLRQLVDPLWCSAADCSTEPAIAAVSFMSCQTYFQHQLTCGLATSRVTGV
jgi:hypothetical protein